MNLSQIAAAATSNTTPEEGTFSLPKAIVGALAGALVVGLIYGVVGRFVNEYAYLAVLIGSASGLGAVRLGGRPSTVAGIVGAVASLVMVLAAKVIVGAPEGYGFIEYHTTMFDILFCYLANPVAAFVAGGTGVGRGMLSRLPF